jgi:hypothetical protein
LKQVCTEDDIQHAALLATTWSSMAARACEPMAIRRIEPKAAAQAEAAKPAEPSYAWVTFLLVALLRLKRDLKNQGMTEAQIHEIISDVPPRTGRAQATTAKPPAPVPS